MTGANAAAVRGALPRSFSSGVSQAAFERLALYCLIGSWLLFRIVRRDPLEPGAAFTLRVVHHIRPNRGALALGTGAGIAFMSKGLLGPGVLALTALALALLPAWRTRRYALALLVAALAFAPWASIWPWLLYRESPALFHEWLVVNNIGPFIGPGRIRPEKDPPMYLQILPRFALPALPLAAWHAWTAHRTGRRPWQRPEIQLPLVAACMFAGVLSVACTARYVYALPILIPLSLLASARPAMFPASLATPLRFLAIVTGAVLGLALWLGWLVLLMHWPASFADRIGETAPRFRAPFEPRVILLAVGATAGLVFLTLSTRRSPGPRALTLAPSLTLPWVLCMTLWLSYFDYGNSYRA